MFGKVVLRFVALVVLLSVAVASTSLSFGANNCFQGCRYYVFMVWTNNTWKWVHDRQYWSTLHHVTAIGGTWVGGGPLVTAKYYSSGIPLCDNIPATTLQEAIQVSTFQQQLSVEQHMCVHH